MTKTVTSICSRLPNCLNVYIIRAMTLQDSVPSHRAKVIQQFLRQNTPDFIAADESASYCSDLNPLDYCIWDILQDLVYACRRFQFATLYRTRKRQSKTTGRRSPLRQFENLLHNGTRSPASAGIAIGIFGHFRTTLSSHNIEYLCLNLFTLRRYNNNERSSGGRQIRTFAPIRG